MGEPEIRLKYAGFVLFGSHLLSVATGFVFVLMVTRSVSGAEFGIWGNLNDLFNYFILVSGVIPFWVTRFTVRKHPGSGKTGLVANLLISFIAIGIYLTLIPTISAVLQISSAYAILYLIASLQIIELHILNALQAVLRAQRPQTIGYTQIVFELVKVIIGYLLILQLGWGLEGALYSLIVAYAIRIAFYMKLTSKEFQKPVKWKYVREWIKAAPINVYNIVGNRIAAFSLILLFAYGGELARAYHGAATSFTNIINHSSFLAFALYPRLLSGGNSKDITMSLKLVMMFAIPMTLGVIVLSDSYLTILQATYAKARLVLILMAISTLFLTTSQIFNSVVMGVEQLDVQARIPFRKLMKSKLFLLFTLPYLQSAIMLPVTYFILTSITTAPLDAAIYVALMILLANFGVMIGRYRIAHTCDRFGFPWRSIAKYVLAATMMTILFVIIPHPTRLSTTFALTLVGATAYFIVLICIDKETKSLVRSILTEVARASYWRSTSLPD